MLVSQLKDMIREKDETYQKKEKEFKELNATFSKHKLQTKSKIAGLNAQLEETKRHQLDALETVSKKTFCTTQ